MAVDITQIPVDIKIDDQVYRQEIYTAPDQNIPERDKTAGWFFRNIAYIITYYNRPVGTLVFPNVADAPNASSGTNGTRGANDVPLSEREYPVQFMIRMLKYYLGKQPNSTFNWVTSDVTTTNMQAQWIRGQEVSEFVNFFKGSIMEKIGNAEFTAKPMSKNSTSEREETYNKIMLKYDLKPVFEQFKQVGASWNPANGKDFQMPEEVEKWMDTDFKEYGAELAGDIANGIWFSNHWSSKVLQAFMHTTCTSLCGMEHYVENGRTKQRIRMPYQMIFDNRIDDDYGRYDEFVAVIDNMTPLQIFKRWPQFTKEQQREITMMSQDNNLGGIYNATQNLIWWTYGTLYKDNMITTVTCYWKTRRDTGYQKRENRYKTVKLQKKKKTEDDAEYVVEDVCKATLVGNRYLVDYGYIDNLVEDVQNKSCAMLPLIRFRPNTFLGESISEVARVHKIQDELDFYDFKIREMIGRAAGKVYILRGSKFGTSTPKEFYEDIKSMGAHVVDDNGEDNDPDNDRRIAEMLDYTLDPGIQYLANLYAERRERMGRILNTSQAAMGQVSRYLGLGSIQNAQAQSNLGVSYLMNGFMDWIVMNMRYAVNQQVKLAAFGQEENLPFLIGDRGMQYIKLLDKERLKFEDFFIILNINDVIDEQRRGRLLSVAQAEAQNGRISMPQYISLEASNSMTEATEKFEYFEKVNEKKSAENAKVQEEAALRQVNAEGLMKAELEQLKQDNENYRSQLNALSKSMSDINKHLSQLQPPQPPATSPLTVDLNMETANKQQQVEQQMQQGPPQEQIQGA